METTTRILFCVLGFLYVAAEIAKRKLVYLGGWHETENRNTSHPGLLAL